LPQKQDFNQYIYFTYGGYFIKAQNVFSESTMFFSLHGGLPFLTLINQYKNNG